MSSGAGALGRSACPARTVTPRAESRSRSTTLARPSGRSPAAPCRASRGSHRSEPARTTATVGRQRRPGSVDQAEIGGQLVAQMRPVEMRQQRGLVGEAGRQTIGQRAMQADRTAGRQGVRQTVAIVVDRIQSLPGERREHDENPTRSAGRSRRGAGHQRHRGVVGARTEREHVEPGRPRWKPHR